VEFGLSQATAIAEAMDVSAGHVSKLAKRAVGEGWLKVQGHSTASNGSSANLETASSISTAFMRKAGSLNLKRTTRESFETWGREKRIAASQVRAHSLPRLAEHP